MHGQQNVKTKSFVASGSQYQASVFETRNKEHGTWRKSTWNITRL